MAKIRILVSLTTNDNDYQIEQAQSAEQAASKLGVAAEIIYANNDAINQSTQILRAIQTAPADRPGAIVFEPVGGTALPQVARAAANANIGWAVLNRDANYIEDLRRGSNNAIFAISSATRRLTVPYSRTMLGPPFTNDQEPSARHIPASNARLCRIGADQIVSGIRCS